MGIPITPPGRRPPMITTTLPIDVLAVEVELLVNGLEDRLFALQRQLSDTRRCLCEMTLVADDPAAACDVLLAARQLFGGLTSHTNAIDRALTHAAAEALELI